MMLTDTDVIVAFDRHFCAWYLAKRWRRCHRNSDTIGSLGRWCVAANVENRRLSQLMEKVNMNTLTRYALLAAALCICVWTPAHASPPTYDGKPGTTAGQQCINPKDGAAMVWVPAGKFTMGADLSQFGGIRRKMLAGASKHKVTLSGFWIYKNDVTVAEYRAFTQATGHQMPWSHEGAYPVVCVTWDDATAYATWAGGLLPTEAQWEKAARGTDGRDYPWGNEWDDKRWAHSTGKFATDLGSPEPVGSCPSGASPYGCLDMKGNVWQWCADWYDDSYWSSPASRALDPCNQSIGRMKDRVCKGGASGTNISNQLPVAYRTSFSPDTSNEIVGFRCVLRPN